MSLSRQRPPSKLIIVNEQRALEQDGGGGSQKPMTTLEVINMIKKTKEGGGEGTAKRVLFDTVTIYHFIRSQGFSSIPSQGGSTLGMKRRHFFMRKLSVDLFEEVRRRSRNEVLLKIKMDQNKNKNYDENNCNSLSLPISSTSSVTVSDNDSVFNSNSEFDNCNHVFCQPIGVKLRRSLLKASGVSRFDSNEKKDCKKIRDSRDRSGCNCVNRCLPELCECSQLGVNCHVDRVSFPCGCNSSGCQNPAGRTEFDVKRVKEHLFEKLFKMGVG